MFARGLEDKETGLCNTERGLLLIWFDYVSKIDRVSHESAGQNDSNSATVNIYLLQNRRL